MTAPRGTAPEGKELSVTDALSSIRSKRPASLYVFAPGDDYFVPQVREAARSLVGETFRPFDYAEFEGREENVDAIREFLGSESFGSERKVLVITSLEDKTAKRLAGLTSLFFSAGTTSVVFGDPAKIPPELLAKACVTTNYAVPPAAVRAWIKKRLDGRAMDDQATYELMQRTAGSFFLMRNEIDRLLAYTAEPITLADVREVVPRCHVAAAAALVEAVSLRKYDRVVTALSDLSASGAPDTTILYDVELGFIRLLNAKLVSKSNRPRADLRAWCLRSQHQYLDDYTLTALLKAADHIRLSELELVLEHLEDIEYRAKKGLASNALAALELLLSETVLTTQES
ncbi:MAG: DNA polymerase III subunit delta [Candidatus Cryosericum sp.]